MFALLIYLYPIGTYILLVLLYQPPKTFLLFDTPTALPGTVINCLLFNNKNLLLIC